MHKTKYKTKHLFHTATQLKIIKPNGISNIFKRN